MLLDLPSIVPPPYDPLRDPIWQFIGVIGAIVIGIVYPILITRFQRHKKEITYQLVSDAPIASVNKLVESRVEILFDNHKVENAKLIVIKLWNSGNLSVRPEDYFDPIAFQFTGGKLISSDLLKTTPKNLMQNETPIIGTEFIEIPKIGLNPNDSLTLSVTLTDDYDFNVLGRIADGKIKEYNLNESQNKFFRRTMTILVTIMVIQFVFFLLELTNNLNSNVAQFIFTILNIPFTITLTIYMLLSWSKRRKANEY